MVKKNEVKIVTDQQTTNFELNNDEKVFVEVSNFNGTINIRRINDLKIYDPKPLSIKNRVETGYKNSSLFKSSIDETDKVLEKPYEPSIVSILGGSSRKSYIDEETNENNDTLSDDVIETEIEKTSSDDFMGIDLNSYEEEKPENISDDNDIDEESLSSSLKNKYFPVDEDE